MANTAVESSPIVWLIARSLEPRGRSFSTLRLARDLSLQGFRPVLVCESDRDIPRGLRGRLHVEVVPHLTSRLWSSRALANLIRRTDHPPAIVHTQMPGIETIGAEISDAFQCPHVLTVHTELAVDSPLEVALAELTMIVAVNPSAQRSVMLRASAPAEMVRLIPSGVDVPEMPVLPPLRDPKRIPVVGTASPLEPGRGVLYLLMAAELILAAGHDVEFLVAGSGPEEDVLRRAATKLDIANRVTFVTQGVPFTKIIESLDVFVMPNIDGGVGSLLMEALAIGKPAVATRVGGFTDFLVEGEHALLCEPRNHTLLADRIEYLLDYPAKARQLALNGQQLVRERFTSERMAHEMAGLYRELISRSHSTSSLARKL